MQEVQRRSSNLRGEEADRLIINRLIGRGACGAVYAGELSAPTNPPPAVLSLAIAAHAAKADAGRGASWTYGHVHPIACGAFPASMAPAQAMPILLLLSCLQLPQRLCRLDS